MGGGEHPPVGGGRSGLGRGPRILGCSGRTDSGLQGSAGPEATLGSQGPRVPKEPDRGLEKGPTVRLGPALPPLPGLRGARAGSGLGGSSRCADPAPPPQARAQLRVASRPLLPRPPPLPPPPGSAAGPGDRDATTCRRPHPPPGPCRPLAASSFLARRAPAPASRCAPTFRRPALPATGLARNRGGRSRDRCRAGRTELRRRLHGAPSADRQSADRGAWLLREASALGLGVGRRGGASPGRRKGGDKGRRSEAQPLSLPSTPS